MHPQPDSPRMADEARRQIAWRRLLEAALRHGEEILAEEEALEGQSDAAGRLDGQSSGGDEKGARNDSTATYHPSAAT